MRKEGAYALFRATLFYKKKTKKGICSQVEISSRSPVDGDWDNRILGSEK